MKENFKTNFELGIMGKEWLFYNKNSLKRSTIQTYNYLFEKHILYSELANNSINELNSEDIVVYSDNLLKYKLSPKSINCILMIINSIFKYAKNVYGVNPPQINYVKDSSNEMRVLNAAEQKLLERYISENRDVFSFGILFALYTGVRIGELCAITWDDVFDGNVRINKTMRRLNNSAGRSVIMLENPKTKSSCRTIPLPDFLNKAVEARRGSDFEFMLSNERFEKIEPRLMQKHFKEVCKELELDAVTFHTLRHTFATRCIECGFDPKTLSEILGHADVKTTLNRYVHSSLELKRNSMNLLSRIAV